jgi:hypothetical protein
VRKLVKKTGIEYCERGQHAHRFEKLSVFVQRDTGLGVSVPETRSIKVHGDATLLRQLPDFPARIWIRRLRREEDAQKRRWTKILTECSQWA